MQERGCFGGVGRRGLESVLCRGGERGRRGRAFKETLPGARRRRVVSASTGGGAQSLLCLFARAPFFFLTQPTLLLRASQHSNQTRRSQTRGVRREARGALVGTKSPQRQSDGLVVGIIIRRQARAPRSGIRRRGTRRSGHEQQRGRPTTTAAAVPAARNVVCCGREEGAQRRQVRGRARGAAAVLSSDDGHWLPQLQGGLPSVLGVHARCRGARWWRGGSGARSSSIRRWRQRQWRR